MYKFLPYIPHYYPFSRIIHIFIGSTTQGGFQGKSCLFHIFPTFGMQIGFNIIILIHYYRNHKSCKRCSNIVTILMFLMVALSQMKIHHLEIVNNPLEMVLCSSHEFQTKQGKNWITTKPQVNLHYKGVFQDEFTDFYSRIQIKSMGATRLHGYFHAFCHEIINPRGELVDLLCDGQRS